jgi:HPt (histidine-containing phosphotransfer) domain-containing protein
MHGSGNSISVLDRDQLREITFDDPDLMREIVSMLINDTSRQIHLLDSAIRGRDAQQCVQLAHYCKGACATVGANSAAAVFKRIEGDASAGNLPGCGTAFGSLAREMELLRAEALTLDRST